VSRIVVTRPDGFITFAAISWLHGVGADLVQLDWDGAPLMATAPRPNGDFPSLRRAQALAAGSPAGIAIARDILRAKLGGQATVLRFIGKPETAETIEELTGRLAAARTNSELLSVEALGALAYWSPWAELPVRFARRDGVPEHWRALGPRHSPLDHSPHTAVTPGNAMLNYLYGVAAGQCIIAITKCGRDAGLGILHADKPGRASLAYDIMETVRPAVDLWLFDWLREAVFSKRDFGEGSNGAIRISRPLTSHLAMTAALWRQPADDAAAWVAKRLAGEHPKLHLAAPLRRLDEEAKRHAIRWRIGGVIEEPLPKTCRECGKALSSRRRKFCSDACSSSYYGDYREYGIGLAAMAAGRARGLSPDRQEAANQQRRDRNRKTVEALRDWEARPGWSPASDAALRAWYTETLGPAVMACRLADLRNVIGFSPAYAFMVRAGKCVPHPRHYAALASLAGVETLPPGIDPVAPAGIGERP